MIRDSLDDVSWPSVAAAIAVALVIGVAWFSPILFGRAWARHVSSYSRIPATDLTADASQPRVLAKWSVAIAASAIALSLVVENTRTDSAVDGAGLGLVLSTGIGAAFFSWPPIFTRLPWQWWLINSGAFVVMLAAMGAVIGAWQ